ncbi:hypothetical protein [Streptomyces sp. NPDC051214]|uniref:hypothetical protein n=1 Tax=Streptomyces sp. NPDC051214 TaxID=3155282 RepID=UPI0034480E7E
MTSTGSGKAKASTRSTLPSRRTCCSISRRSPAVSSSIRGRSASTRRGANAAVVRRRSRVWSGASELSMCRARQARACCAGESAFGRPAPCGGTFEKRGSARTARVRSYPVTSQAYVPLASGARVAGPWSRRRA